LGYNFDFDILFLLISLDAELIALKAPSATAQFAAIIWVEELHRAIRFKMVSICSYFPLPDEVLSAFVVGGRVTCP
jgi:hypothetical protein